MKTKITFYKDNQISGEFQKDISEIVKEFAKSEFCTQQFPFEREFLYFLSKEYGSFDIISDEQWAEIYKEMGKMKKLNLQ